MATPHVAGIAALVRERFGNAGYAEIKQRIIRSVDPLAAFDGLTITGGRANLKLALSLFSDLVLDANGLRSPAWFGGTVSDAEAPWYYHQKLDWFYTLSSSVNGVGLYLQAMDEWLWTTAQSYPNFYRASDGVWLYYINTSPTLWFYNQTTLQYESYTVN